MATYHLTKAGPRPCRATKGPCPYGKDAHFDSKEEATAIFERRLALENKTGKLSKRGMYSKNKKTLVLSDVDGTLVDGSLVLEHAAYLHEQGVIDLGDLPARWNADQKDENLVFLLADAYRSQLLGMNLKELRIDDYMAKVMESEKFYSALERLKKHKRAGHDVILVSGSPSFLVGEFAKKFGFVSVGSQYHLNRSRRFNGRITGMFGADAKEGVVRKLRPQDYDYIVAYGDTASDKPLLDAANYSVLVHPTNETLRKVTKVDEILSD